MAQWLGRRIDSHHAFQRRGDVTLPDADAAGSDESSSGGGWSGGSHSLSLHGTHRPCHGPAPSSEQVHPSSASAQQLGLPASPDVLPVLPDDGDDGALRPLGAAAHGDAWRRPAHGGPLPLAEASRVSHAASFLARYGTGLEWEPSIHHSRSVDGLAAAAGGVGSSLARLAPSRREDPAATPAAFTHRDQFDQAPGLGLIGDDTGTAQHQLGPHSAFDAGAYDSAILRDLVPAGLLE
ncbi:hypothetical protein FNF27_05191 [Cafeteria roenbergensis]|uniref:Uncharacterized protein n=1 Tax=Cafeteria roenbergensis TaxID=33653 RepID=A0A5A8CAR5_CAFRO|nr:hypothetical protein FNF29_08294 [Cafeteria roenbergensis]KAA0150015.1 hypothetical protein FNF31_07101 [Cafeteria roenbergensis]KAA0173265.1 hypothetical protein FNF27_05191 [Cafeteria roenbergensis]|eukprot:KAA0146026.1 hypothetical protein FNF29_08294 [Cafeteria roenbergensis]